MKPKEEENEELEETVPPSPYTDAEGPNGEDPGYNDGDGNWHPGHPPA